VRFPPAFHVKIRMPIKLLLLLLLALQWSVDKSVM
jgi:hypothetical protein